jgi:hypothetical protein
MARAAIFQYPSLVHIFVKTRRQNHAGAHFGPLRAKETGTLISALHAQPILLSLSSRGITVRDSILKTARESWAVSECLKPILT